MRTNSISPLYQSAPQKFHQNPSFAGASIAPLIGEQLTFLGADLTQTVFGPQLSKVMSDPNIQKTKQVFQSVSKNLISDTIQLAKEIWAKIKIVFGLIIGVLHKAVKYIGQNPILLFPILGEFHHH